jgi:pimeloyl-ACP methyl ester carboxylesterase
VRELLLARSRGSVTVRSTPGPGTPDAPVFVLVHGIGMSHRYFDRLHAVLAETSAVHSVDLPGFGRSPKPDHGVTIEQYADYLGELLPTLSESPVVLVGHSMGAQFVTETAVRHPALIAQLVLIGGVTDPTRGSALRQALALGRDTLKEPLTGTMIVLRDYLLCGPRWYLTTLRPMLTYRTDLRLRLVSAPTLVIRGLNDPVSRRDWGVRLAEQAPLGRLLELPGRHLVHFSAAAATAAGILAFVRAAAVPGPITATGPTEPREPVAP